MPVYIEICLPYDHVQCYGVSVHRTLPNLCFVVVVFLVPKGVSVSQRRMKQVLTKCLLLAESSVLTPVGVMIVLSVITVLLRAS